MALLCGIVLVALLRNLMEGITLPHEMEGSEDKAAKEEEEDFQQQIQQEQKHNEPQSRPVIASNDAPALSPSHQQPADHKGQPSSSHNNAPSNPTNPTNPSHNPPPTIQSNHSSSFTDRWCDLRGVEWFPTDHNKAWQQRAPYFIIPGAKYSGTSVLTKYLLTVNSCPHHHHHQLIPPLRTTQLGFFRESSFRGYVTAKRQVTKVFAARARMYARDYPVAALQYNPTAISLDASPGYLYYSSLLPRRILCVMPWIKLVVLLRNPVDRLYHQYVAAVRGGWKTDLETWVQQDWRIMQTVGLVQNSTTSNTDSLNNNNNHNKNHKPPPRPLNISQSSSTEQEDLAWFQYHRTSREGPVGRSLYDIQLRQWFQALRAAGKNPATDVLIVWTEQLRTQPQHELERILQFLGLDSCDNNNNNNNQLHSNAAAAMSSLSSRLVTPPDAVAPATRQRLEKFFAPYNKRLKKLLKQYGVEYGGGM